jgi:Ca2+-binding RTX toxin-like protein
LEISLGDNDNVTIVRDGTNFRLITFGGDLACTGGTPTVNNVDSVHISGSTGVNTTTLLRNNGAFAPGASNEPGSSDEIEFHVDFGASDNFFVSDAPPGQGSNVRAGTGGMNLNANEATGRDVDVFFPTSYPGYIQIVGREEEPNILSGAGGGGTGNPFPDRVDLHGGDVGDRITGGDGDDYIDGKSGRDVVLGGAGADDLEGGPGRDKLSHAGPGAVVSNLSTGVTVEDGNGFSDVVGGFENLAGGSGPDDLSGTDLKNKITGGGGRDLLFGYGGDDRLLGGDGRDELQGDIGADLLNGGRRRDTCLGGPGRDELRSCEAGSS